MEHNRMVSVFMMAFNHENTIESALDSILMQKVDFDYEIVIGEDGSRDNTRDILLKYAQRYPDKFNLILHEKNVGAVENQRCVFSACRGKYTAILEGDDYWTDSEKLQKQVDFLEANPEYGLVHTDNSNLKEKTGDIIRSHKEVYYPNPPDGNVFERLLLKNFVSTLTVMVRTDIIKQVILNLYTWIAPELRIDYALWLETAQLTKFKYLNDITAMYRAQEGTASKPTDDYKRSLFYKKRYDIVNSFFQKYEVNDVVQDRFYHDFFTTYLNRIYRLNRYYHFQHEEMKKFVPVGLKYRLFKFFHEHQLPRCFYFVTDLPYRFINKIKKTVRKC